MFSNRILVVVIVSLIVGCDSQPKVDRYDGESCRAKGYDGTCKRVDQCPVVLEAIKMYKRHDFTRCNFEGRTEFVCCPNDDTEFREPDIHRISDMACEEYSTGFLPEISFQILNGENATAGEFPHMAALAYRDVTTGNILWNCGGSLISKNFVLTAAHCIINVNQQRPYMVRLGKLSLINDNDNLEAQDIEVENITIHDKYSRRTRSNDIALIKLKKPVTITKFVRPACLYNKDDNPIGVQVTGWGLTEANGTVGSLGVLQKATLSPVEIPSCNISFYKAVQTEIIPIHFCARSPDGSKDTCQGDSGGPIQVQDKTTSNIYRIVGVTSVGVGCGGSIPGLYTRVSKYINWIESIVWPSS